jgi:DNA-binding IclR family transcriptional regulator
MADQFSSLPEASLSKTLDRGLQTLEFIADNPSGVTLAGIARHLGVHRTIAHRLVGTLEHHDLVRRTPSKLIMPAVGLIRLAESVDQDLRAVARPLLQDLADKLSATAHLVVTTGAESVQALLVIEPAQADVHIAFRAGQVHPISRGSAGMAILAARSPQANERAEIAAARERGYAVSTAEVVPLGWGVSAAVPSAPGMPEMSIGVSLFDDSRVDEFGPLVVRQAQQLSVLLGSGSLRTAAFD